MQPGEDFESCSLHVDTAAASCHVRMDGSPVAIRASTNRIQMTDFFFVTRDDTSPWAQRAFGEQQLVDACDRCGRGTWAYVSRVRVQLEDLCASWPDAIGGFGGTPGHLLLSERAALELGELGTAGYDLLETDIEAERNPPQNYFLVSARLGVALERMPGFEEHRCPTCWRFQFTEDVSQDIRDAATEQIGRYFHRPLPIIAGTWNGSHFFKAGIRLACSKAVLELARKSRWTNLSFNCIDTTPRARTAVGWSGIDYLGSQWPPERWYPEPE